MTSEIRCDSCRTELPPDLWNRPEGVRCPVCRKQAWVSVFPAIRKQFWGSAADALTAEGEASCYYHPQSRAELACDSCGRFLCKLCDLDVGGRHVCPVCLQQGASAQTEKALDQRRVLYDSIVLGLSILGPLTFLWPSLITGPLTVVLSVWYWNKPRSIVPRTRIRFILAIVFGLAQCVFWGALIWAVATAPAAKRSL